MDTQKTIGKLATSLVVLPLILMAMCEPTSDDGREFLVTLLISDLICFAIMVVGVIIYKRRINK